MINEKDCWEIEKQVDPVTEADITVCKGDKAIVKGDPSVGIPDVEAEVKKVFETGSVLVEDEEGREKQAQIGNVKFEAEMEKQSMERLKADLSALRSRLDDSVKREKVGEDLRKGQKVVHIPSSDLDGEKGKQGRIEAIKHEVMVEWEDNTTSTEDVDKVMDAEEWEDFREEFQKGMNLPHHVTSRRNRNINWDRF